MSRIIFGLLLLGMIGGFFYYDLGQYLNLRYIKLEQANLTAYVQQQQLLAAGIFFAIYIVVTALSLPGAAIMTLVGGAVFGLWWGTWLVSFASTMGATMAMLVTRFILRNQVSRRFGDSMQRIDHGVAKEGAFYLFTLRLVPVVPFFVINLVIGLTRIPTFTFFWVSQVGMLPGTLVYVNAGTQLAEIESLSDIASPGLLAAFFLLGIFPLIAKKLVGFMQATKLLRQFPKPTKFDQDVVVIGAGSGGLVAALIAATVKAKVTLIETHKMGGDCLNTGCVPSKSLIRSAKFAYDMNRATAFGFNRAVPDFDFAQIMARVHKIIQTIEPHDSVARYESLGVACEIGAGSILSPYVVAVNGKTITTRNIIIATGASPLVPPIPGIAQVDYLTSDNLWQLRQQPRRLVVLGGGSIGTELTQAFNRLGSEVTQVEALPRILNREDPEISELITAKLQTEGIKVLTNTRATAVEVIDNDKYLIVESAGTLTKIPFDALLVAVGRKANVVGFGLGTLGVGITDHGTVEVDVYLRTNYPNIYAIGDVAGPYQFTHTASHMAWYATVNALFGTFRKFAVDYRVIPWATFTGPEVARVGLNETEAKAQGIAIDVTRYDIKGLDRALADEEAYGLVKVITAKGKDTILGATIVADHAGDLMAEYVLAMKHGLGLNKILNTIHIYPTLVEMNKFAASEWRKANKPDWALNLAAKYHRWRRG